MLDEALIQLAASDTAAATAADGLIFVKREGWHPGVIGIVASRLVERFHQPAVVGAVGEETIVASARSVPGVDIGAAIKAAMAAGLLVKGGGHPMAGGFTAHRQRAAELSAFLAAELGLQQHGVTGMRPLHLEAGLSLAAVDVPMLRLLDDLAPYGSGNPEPVFAFPAVQVQRVTVVGAEHVRCQIRDGHGGATVAMAFRAARSPLGQALLGLSGEHVHIAGRLRPGRNGYPPFIALEDAALPY